jgi:hypothetical protein
VKQKVSPRHQAPNTQHHMKMPASHQQTKAYQHMELRKRQKEGGIEKLVTIRNS